MIGNIMIVNVHVYQSKPFLSHMEAFFLPLALLQRNS